MEDAIGESFIQAKDDSLKDEALEKIKQVLVAEEKVTGDSAKEDDLPVDEKNEFEESKQKIATNEVIKQQEQYEINKELIDNKQESSRSILEDLKNTKEDETSNKVHEVEVNEEPDTKYEISNEDSKSEASKKGSADKSMEESMKHEKEVINEDNNNEQVESKEYKQEDIDGKEEKEESKEAIKEIESKEEIEEIEIKEESKEESKELNREEENKEEKIEVDEKIEDDSSVKSENIDDINKDLFDNKGTTFGKPEVEESTDEVAITSEQKQCFDLVKASLNEAGVTIEQLIGDKIVIGKSEDGTEFEVITIPELVSSLLPICKNIKSPKQLEDLFRTMVGNEENYMMVQDLLDVFGENDGEELLEGINELDEEAVEIMAGILQWMQESNADILDLFKNVMYQQTVGLGDENVVLELIDAKDFYEILYKLRLGDKENKSLSKFLCLDKQYPNVFLVKKIMKLLEHIAIQIEQQGYAD